MNEELNKRIAEALGWQVDQRIEPTFQGADTMTTRALYSPSNELVYFHPFHEATEAECWRHVPDFCADLNAVAAVLARHDITLRLDFGPAYSARIIPEGRVNEPPMPEFYAGNWEHLHADISELAALAFADWLTWLREQGGTP